MIAETISLGILSLPKVLATIGLVPGVVLIAGLGALATYTGFVLGQFKLRYPYVHNMADAGEVLFGPIGREVFGIAQMLFLIFVMGSHILTFSIMLNTISEHGSCTIVFGVIGMVVSLICTLPRTLKNVSYLCIASFVSIIAAVVITMVGVGIEKPGNGSVQVTVDTSFPEAFLLTSNIIFAYAGHVTFFSFISELRDPTEYPKALGLLQICDTGMYILVAVVTYRYAGPTVASPALGSTSPLFQKISYGVAIVSCLLHPSSTLPRSSRLTSFPPLPIAYHCHFRRDQRARCRQIHLRPPFSRDGQDVQDGLEILQLLAGHHRRPVDHRVDRRGSDSGLQHPLEHHQRAVCELVHVRDERDVLAVHEQREMVR